MIKKTPNIVISILGVLFFIYKLLCQLAMYSYASVLESLIIDNVVGLKVLLLKSL